MEIKTGGDGAFSEAGLLVEHLDSGEKEHKWQPKTHQIIWGHRDSFSHGGETSNDLSICCGGKTTDHKARKERTIFTNFIAPAYQSF